VGTRHPARWSEFADGRRRPITDTTAESAARTSDDWFRFGLHPTTVAQWEDGARTADPRDRSCHTVDGVTAGDGSLRHGRQPSELERAICSEDHMTGRGPARPDLPGQRDVDRQFIGGRPDSVGVQIAREAAAR